MSYFFPHMVPPLDVEKKRRAEDALSDAGFTRSGGADADTWRKGDERVIVDRDGFYTTYTGSRYVGNGHTNKFKNINDIYVHKGDYGEFS